MKGDFDALEKRIREWQTRTFPPQRLEAVATHLLSEAVEFAAACGLSVADVVAEVNRTLNKLTKHAPGEARKELGDIVHLAVGSAALLGETVFAVTERVFVENLDRKWGAVQPNGIVEHVDGDDREAVEARTVSEVTK